MLEETLRRNVDLLEHAVYELDRFDGRAAHGAAGPG